MTKLKERLVEQSVKRASFTRVVKQVEQTCATCEKKFWGASIRKYCSQACRQRANYARHAEQYRAARMESYRRQKV
jgi:hypothetical protein